MPWKVEKVGGSKPYAVVRADTGKVVSTHTSKTLAHKSKAVREVSYYGKSGKKHA